MIEDPRGATVISLEEWRLARLDPLTEFTRAVDELFTAMDLLEAVPGPRAQKAHAAVYEAVRLLLDREKRVAR